MTNDGLTGHHLDRACAEAIYRGGRIDHPDHPAHGRAYSTDAATLPEKLAWLSQRGRTTLDQHSEDDGWWARNRAQAVHPQSAHGSTLDEAVARLVVAVANAEAEAKR